uniref:Ectopic P granules protein 5 homolog n=2 Tax=Photinus pyralis TaxID=7054 RepID=A0A1Y1N595_PHOPY
MEAVLEKQKSKQKKKKPKEKVKEKPKDEEDTGGTAEVSQPLVGDEIRIPNIDTVELPIETHEEKQLEHYSCKSETVTVTEAPIIEKETSRPLIKAELKAEISSTFNKYLLENKEIMKSIKLSELDATAKAEKFKVAPLETIKPYTESQLASLYTNIELETVEQFASQFVEAELKGIAIKRHPLYELLDNYLQARHKMTGNLLESVQLRKEYKETQGQIWSVQTALADARGECHDGTAVSASHPYNKATFHRSIFQTIERVLSSLQKIVTENHVLYSYLAEVFKLKVELFIEILSANCFKCFELDYASRMCLKLDGISPNVALLSELRLCISVLFSFQRRLIRDVQFIKETREWLNRLVAIFLRVANWQDHLFILNHILRCPAGVCSWAAHFVQLPLPDKLQESPFASAEINHVIAVLSAILMPIQKREQFLEQLSQSMDNSDDVLWVIVDSEGEEDEDSSGTALRENDLVQLLNQLPLNNLFKDLLLVRSHDGQDVYDNSNINENHVLRFLSLCTVLLRILQNGLETYDQPRYQQLSKRLCRFVRHIVQYATDQWEQFKKVQRMDDRAMLQRLQVEYDAFFLRATQYLYSSQKMGAWQFLAVVPYHIVSMQTLWKIFYLLHDDNTEILKSSHSTQFKQKIWSEALRDQFEEKLSQTDDAESYYLINTFANMVLAREEVDMEFIRIATLDLLQIGFISESTQESCSKNARILLTHITSKYPELLSDILGGIRKKFANIGSLSLYLYEELPLSVWIPSAGDIEIIIIWLTQNVIASDESRLARMILSRLNWGMDDGALFLPYSLHFKVALLLAEIVEQEAGYLQWAWQTAFRLRLHFNDKGFSDLSRVVEPDNLSVISKGVRDQKPFPCFLALMMTSWGHLVPLIGIKGLSLLETLQTHQKHDAVLFALHLIVPLFLTCQESLINCDKYQTILVSLLSSDRTYINMAKGLLATQCGIVDRFGYMIESQIQNYKWYGLDSPRYLIRLWINSLVSIPNWNKDPSVLKVLDIILKAAFFRVDAMDAAVNILRELLQTATPQESNTSITSLFKWASQSTLPQGSLLAAASLPSCVWLAYILIALEHEEREKVTGLWREVLTQLQNQKGKVNVDAAIKKAASSVKVPSFTSSSLCIYRWAQQALDTSLDHPLLPLVWQKFFMLFLLRVPVTSVVERGCLGEKFFDGMINLGFLKRLKRRLQETVDYYQKKVDGCDNDGMVQKKAFYESCLRLFRAYSLWLEEPRLQETNLHLPSLPPQYEARLLALIIQENSAPWLEYLDYDVIKTEQENSMKSWRMSIYREKSNVNQPLFNAGAGVESSDPVERIVRRLKSYDVPKEAPNLVKSAPVIPTLDINEHASIVNIVEPHFKTLLQFAHNHTLRVSEHKALDSTYKELVPQLYRAVLFKVKKHVACKGTGNSVCTGAATIILEMQDARINERIDRQIQCNRSDYELVLSKSLQAPAQALCSASVTITHAISILDTKATANSNMCEMGVEFFYHILTLVNDEVNYFPPTKNAFMTFIEKLGHRYITGVEYETPRLLNKILEEPNLVPLLAPHFSPINIGTTNFLHMYSTICADAGQRFDIIFPLLSKFDIQHWLTSKQPKLAQRSQFIELVLKGLTSLNFTPTTESMMLHEMFRKHLLCIFEYQFPEHYGDVLTALLKASHSGADTGCIAISVWMDIFNSLSLPVKLKTNGVVRDQLRQYAHQQQMLQYQEILETARLLSTHFFKERLQYGLYGLYPKYRNYMEVLILLMGMTGHAFVISALNTHHGLLGDKLCEIIWPCLREMYAPWILPYWMNNIKDEMVAWMQQLTDDRTVLLPWIPADGPFAQKAICSMFECIMFVIHTLPACNVILSYVWHWYVTNFAHQAVKDYILNAVHASFLALPWHNFWPSVGDLELMLKVVEQYLPECHVFLGYIFIEVPWNNWIQQVLANATPAIILRVHQCLLYLLVKLSNEPNIRSNYSDKAKALLVQAENFNWEVVEPGMYQQIVDWYVMSCDPLVLFTTDPLDLDFRVLNFLKISAHYHESYEHASDNVFLKQHIFIRSFVKLISVLCSKHKAIAVAKTEQLNSVISASLLHLETVIRREEALVIVLEDMVGILNIDLISNGATQCFERWLSTKTSESIILKAMLHVLPSSVNNSEVVASLVESAVFRCFFNIDHNNFVSPWKYLVKYLRPYPPKQLELEKCLVAKGKLLTLHVLLLQKTATCTDSTLLLNTILRWLEELKLDAAMEDKVPLIWSQFLKLTIIHCNIDMRSGSTIVYKFSQLLLQQSAEKGISGWGKGILGAIGIVKSESLSLRFRFLCRALAGYVLAQLPETKGHPQTVRICSNAPAIVGQPGGNTECVKVLLGLAMGQTQGEIKTCAELALKLIQDPINSLHNSRTFLSLIVTQLYTKPYLKDIDNC